MHVKNAYVHFPIQSTYALLDTHTYMYIHIHIHIVDTIERTVFSLQLMHFTGRPAVIRRDKQSLSRTGTAGRPEVRFFKVKCIS
jgi:hypothetical protein